MNVMKTTHSFVATAQLKQLNEFARKLAHSSRRDKWAEKLLKLTEQEIHFVLEYLTGEQLTELITLLPANRAGLLLHVMDKTALNTGLTHANPRVIEKALRTLPEEELHQVLSNMFDQHAQLYRERLRWDEESVAAHMHSQRLPLLESQTVVEAKEVLYEAWGDPQARHRLYVVNQHGLLLGAITPKALLMAHSDQSLTDLIEHQRLTLDADLDQEQAARLLLEHNLSVLPVVHQQKLVGFFHLEEAVSILEQETTEDAEMQGGQCHLMRATCRRHRGNCGKSALFGCSYCLSPKPTLALYCVHLRNSWKRRSLSPFSFRYLLVPAAIVALKSPPP